MRNISATIDPALQEEIASVAFNDKDFASTFYRLTGGKLDKLKLFTNPNLDLLMRILFSSYDKNEGLFPTEGEMLDEVLQLDRNDSDKKLIRDLFLKVKKRDIPKAPIHERKIVELVKSAQIVGFLNESLRTMRQASSVKDILAFESQVYSFQENLEKVTFSKDDVIDMTDFKRLIYEYASDSNSNVQIGLEKIASELNGGGENGGVARQEVTIFVAGTNDAKSIAMNSFIGNAAMKEFKSCIFSLEGKKYQAPMRFLSNISKINYKKLVRFRDFINKQNKAKLEEYFSPDELKRLDEAENLYSSRVHMVHAIKSCEIESIEARAEEIYRKEPFDLLIVDYGQLIESVKEFPREDLMLQYAFRKLEKLAAKLNVAVIVPMQVNRAGLNALQQAHDDGEEYPTYKLGHVAGGYATVKTAGCVIAISRTVEERNEGKMRYCILKQREGIVGVQWGVKANFDVMDVTTGEEYYYFNPGQITQAPPRESLMDSFDTGNSNVKIDSIIQSNDILRRFNESDLDSSDDEFIKFLSSASGLKSQIKEANDYRKGLILGNIESDNPDEEIEQIDENLIKLKARLYELVESDLFISKREELLGERDLRLFSNILEIVSQNKDAIEKDYPRVFARSRMIFLLNQVEDEN